MNVRIENTGDKDLSNITASISDHPANVTVVQGNVKVGDIKAGDSVWSSDTFRIKTDISNSVDPSEGILWNIEYDDAQGMHHVIKNVPQ